MFFVFHLRQQKDEAKIKERATRDRRFASSYSSVDTRKGNRARSGTCKDDIYLEFISLEEKEYKKVGKKRRILQSK